MEYARETGLTIEDCLRGWIAAARRNPHLAYDPKPGDLVVEISSFRSAIDPDAIGWLIAHDQAPYEAHPLDGSMPLSQTLREVWDVLPLNPNAKLQTIGGEQFQRWENAQFAAIPERDARLAGIISPLAHAST